MRRRTTLLLTAAMAGMVLFAGCGGKNQATKESEESEKTEKEGKGDDTETSSDDSNLLLKVVGIAMPCQDGQEHESADAREMHLRLEQQGYNSRITYAGGDSDLQIEQIAQMIEDQVAAIVVDPVDPYGLTEVLDQAEDAGIPVFAYDTLVMDTNAVTYYLTYNTRKVGQMTARKLIDAMGLARNTADNAEVTETPDGQEERPVYQIEFLMGEPDQLADLYFYNGVMEVLQPYFEEGTLQCLSGNTSFDDTSIMGRSEVRAAKKLQRILSEYYQEETLDILVTADDAFAIQAANLLQNQDYDVSSMFLSGYGCSREGAREITRGRMTCSVYLDYTALADACIENLITYLSGEKPEVDDYEQYDNGIKIIRTIVSDPQMIDRDNYQLLVDSGYYTEQELALTPIPEEADSEETAPTDAGDEEGLEETEAAADVSSGDDAEE